jgi:hypothetical protein
MLREQGVSDAYGTGWRVRSLVSKTLPNRKSPATSHDICIITSCSKHPSATAYSPSSL